MHEVLDSGLRVRKDRAGGKFFGNVLKASRCKMKLKCHSTIFLSGIIPITCGSSLPLLYKTDDTAFFEGSIFCGRYKIFWGRF